MRPRERKGGVHQHSSKCPVHDIRTKKIVKRFYKFHQKEKKKTQQRTKEIKIVITLSEKRQHKQELHNA